MSKIRNTSLLAIVAIGATVVNANAQDDFYNRSKYQAVGERAQPEFDPEAVRLGAFLVDSSVTAALATTDNVFADANDEESDTIISGALDVNARSDWSVHQIGLRGRLGRSEYSDFSDESFTSLDLGASGRLDVSRQFSLGADVSVQDSVQSRATYVNGSELDGPIEFTRTRAQVSADYRNERVRWTNALRLTQFDYDDGFFRGTNTVLEQDFRDNDAVDLTSRLSYAISPNVAVFGQGTVSQTDYDNPQTFVDPTTLAVTQRVRDSDGYIVAGGVDFETANLMRGDIAIGFFSQDNEDPAFQDVDGLSIDGNVQWFPTELTTVSANAGRSVVDNGLLQSPSTLQTQIGARVDHEFSRQVVGSIFADFREDDYEGVERTDDYVNAGVGVLYRMNKRVHINGYLRHVERDVNLTTNAFDPSFSANEIGISLSLFP